MLKGLLLDKLLGEIKLIPSFQMCPQFKNENTRKI